MKNFDLEKLNIFLRITIFDNENNIFIYSNTAGMSYLKEKLSSSNLNDIFTEEEVIKKLLNTLTTGFHSNILAGVENTKWISKKIAIDNEEDKASLNKKWKPWLEKIKSLLGKDNIFIVEVDKKIVRSYLNDNEENLLQFLESTRMCNKLESDLTNKENKVKKTKI